MIRLGIIETESGLNLNTLPRARSAIAHAIAGSYTVMDAIGSGNDRIDTARLSG